MVRAFDEFFSGYLADPVELLERTFEEIDGYDEMVLLRDIPRRCWEPSATMAEPAKFLTMIWTG